MTIETVKLWADTINTILSIIGLIIGGIWVYRKYIIHRTAQWNLKMAVSSQVFPYSENLCMVVLSFKFNNEGTVKITPGKSGCTLSVKKIRRDAQKDVCLDYYDGITIIDKKDILRKYYRDKIGYKNYVIEPKAEYHEVETLIVEKGELLAVRVEFFWKNDRDSITEYSIHQV